MLRWLLFKYWDWRSARAERRFKGCAHRRTTIVDVGLHVEKCLDCWALKLPEEIGGEGWAPNMAPPPKSPAKKG